MQIQNTSPQSLQRLRRELLIYFLACLLFLSVGYFLLRWAWGPRDALVWLVPAALLAVYLFASLWKRLDTNRPAETGAAGLYPTLGLANGITISRAILITGLAGFMFAPPGPGWLAWAPGVLYLAAAAMDFMDGYAARVTRRTTRLGETLDMEWDSIAALVGTAVLVNYGQAPLAYLLVGVARYWFLAGLWIHRRRGYPVQPDLPPNRFRRPLAGVQMGFIGVALLPVFGPPSTWVAAILFMIPHQVGFVYDFLVITGRGKSAVDKNRPAPAAFRALPEVIILVLRALLVGLLVNLVIYQAGWGIPPLGSLIVAALAALAVLLGAAGRVVTLVMLLLAGLNLQVAPLEWRYWLIFFVSAVLFLTGTGRYSLWKPEDWLIDHRAGEASPQ
jgi:CDP-diacylglycerol--glycerol-3-phosphate 3-phosphatidyltransferase